MLAVFPFGTAALLGALYYCGAVNWQKYFAPSFAHRSIAAAFCLLLLIMGFALAVHVSRKHHARKPPLFILLLALLMLTLIPRIIYLCAVGQYITPTSDCHLAYAHALGQEDHSIWYQSTPSWGAYAHYLQMLLAILPDSYVALQSSNVVLDGFIALGIYQLAWRITNKRAVALISGLIYAINPTRIADGMILTPEIPANALFVSALIVLTLAAHRKSIGCAIALTALSGILLGIAHILKPIAPIVIIATGMTLLFYSKLLDTPFRPEQIKAFDALSAKVKRILSAVIALAILILGYSAAKSLCTSDLENWLGKEVYGDPAARFLFVGMRTDSEGQVHLGEGHRLSQEIFRDPNVDHDAANELLLTTLIADLKENTGQIPALLCKKIQWAWQDDVVDFYYSESAIGRSTLLGTFASLGQCAYVILMAFACVGAISSSRKRHLHNAGVFLIALIIFGFALLLLVSEAQSRYKVMIMPYICILAALGIIETYHAVYRRIARRARAQHVSADHSELPRPENAPMKASAILSAPKPSTATMASADMRLLKGSSTSKRFTASTRESLPFRFADNPRPLSENPATFIT